MEIYCNKNLQKNITLSLFVRMHLGNQRNKTSSHNGKNFGTGHINMNDFMQKKFHSNLMKYLLFDTHLLTMYFRR